MKLVCGQTQPQNNRPNAAVKRTIKMIKVTIVIPKIKKSWGQNTFPKMINFASGTLNRKRGLPLYLMNGSVKKSAKKKRLTIVRIL
jgi:hypothetical protein